MPFDAFFQKYFNSDKSEKTDLFLTILLPLISGFLIILAVKPSWIETSSTLNLCLLSLVIILPVWGLNVLMWSLISWKLINRIMKHASSWLDIPDESKELLNSFLNEFAKSKLFYGTDKGRQAASITTVICSYLTATVIYFTKLSFVWSYLCLICLSLICGFVISLLISKIIIKQIKPKHLKALWKNLLKSDLEFKNRIIKKADNIENIIRSKKENESDNSDT